MRRFYLILLLVSVSFSQLWAQGIALQCEEFSTLQYSKDFIDVAYTSSAPVTISATVNGLPRTVGAAKGVKTGVKKFRISNLPEKEYEDCRIKLVFKDNSGKPILTKEFVLKYKDPRSNLYLISIGVNGNQERTFTTLNYPLTDAKTIYSFFNTYASSYYTSKGFRVLCDPEETTMPYICRKLDEVTNDIREGDVFMLYLSGHGEEKGGKYYFVTSDCRKSALETTALSGRRILDYLFRMTAKKARVFVFVDTCHAQALYENEDAGEGVVYYASCKSGEVSNDSVYAQALVKALSGKDGNSQIGNGYITVGSLQDFLYAAVRKTTGFSQNPACSHPGVDESFVIFKAPSVPEFELSVDADVLPARIEPSPDAVTAYSKAEKYRISGDYSKSFQYMLEAAKQNNKDAFFPLADMYHRGLGVKKDREQAEYWYNRAAEQGDARAKKILLTHF